MLANILMVVFSHPQDPAREAEFNEWYTGNHIPDVLHTPGFRETVRYKLAKATSGDIPPYLALYQLDHDDAEAADAALNKHLATPFPWRIPMPPATPPAPGGLVPLDFLWYYRKTFEVGKNDQSPQGAAKAIMVTMTRPAKGVPIVPMNKWYDGHVADIIKTPGFRGAARYELAKLRIGYASPFLAVYELDTDDVEQVAKNLAKQRELWLAGDKSSSYYSSTGPMPTNSYGERWVQADGFAYFSLVSAPTRTPTLMPSGAARS
ncbi:MAG: hypothetical protein HY677_07295 [Chloroflexi bacterium]|nr:hypothetical protein [Chloroflexota bacterium]